MSDSGFGAFVSNVDGAVRRGLLELIRRINNLTTRLTTAEAEIVALEAADVAIDGRLDAVEAHVVDASAAHAASAISYAGGTNMSATDVEAALDELANEKATAASGTYTPTNAGLTLGTGGACDGRYTFVGGPNSGDAGILLVDINWNLGTAGTRNLTSSSFTLPSGFAYTGLGNDTPVGVAWVSNGATWFRCDVWKLNSSLRIFAYVASGSNLAGNDIGNTTPFTWSATNGFGRAFAILRVTRS